MTITMNDTFPDGLHAFAEAFGERLSAVVGVHTDAPGRLIEAMRYSLLAPGKRLRPYLVVQCCTLCGGGVDDAFAAAAAVEMVHAFSLIHDDLPAMDDDDLRRGRATNHRRFGEAMAILAGDALLALAFETLADVDRDGFPAGRLIGELARGAGACGMIGGQAADILGEQQPPAIETVRYIHRCKTACLFEAAARMGAICANAADDAVNRVGTYGRKMGLVFQIADDLLDVSATRQAMGKAVGKDAAKSKQTYPACVGVDQSRETAEQLVAQACTVLEPFGDGAAPLMKLARYAARRTS